VANIIDRSNPGDLASGNGLTFRANLNADRATIYGHIVALETTNEMIGGEFLTDGTLPSNAAVCSIDSPVSGRVYCPIGYKAVINGVAVETTAIISQAYTGSVLNHVFLAVDTAGVLSLRVSTSITAGANDVWIADVTAVPTIDNAPAGKPIVSCSIGTAADGTRAGVINGIYQTLTTSGTPDAENTIAHGLGRVPVGYILVKADKAVCVYDGSSAWTATNIYLKANVASAAITLLIF